MLNKLFRAIITGVYWGKMLNKYNEGIYGDALLYYKKSEKHSNLLSSKTLLFKVLLYYKLGLDREFFNARDEYISARQEGKKFSDMDFIYMDNFLNIMLEEVLGKKLNSFKKVQLDSVSSEIKSLFNRHDIKRNWD